MIKTNVLKEITIKAIISSMITEKKVQNTMITDKKNSLARLLHSRDMHAHVICYN